MEAEKKITILLPTRGRPELLEKSIKSLIEKATNPSDIK